MEQFIGKIYDISMTISEDMPVYNDNNEKRPKLIIRDTFETSNHYESSIILDMHTGTHIDAPLHMIKNGKTMNIYQIDDFISACKVLDFTNVNDRITKTDLETKEINEGDFILLKTKNSFTKQFQNDFVFLDKEGANYLKTKKIKGVGTDGLGIERSQPDLETHKELLGNSIMIVEGLRLKEINEGIYTLIVLPLKIHNTEASPARALLIEKWLTCSK